MPVHHHVLRAVALALASLLLASCAGTGDPEPVRPQATARPADPAGTRLPGAGDPPPPAEVIDGPHEVSIIADFGPLADGSGDAVVASVWTVDAAGTVRFVIDTPAGVADQHVMTDDEHWWWLSPEARSTIADAEWVHFDLRAIEEVGGELPEIVVHARAAILQPGEILVGQSIAGHAVLGSESVGDDEVHLTMAGIERPVVHRRRSLPAGTTVDPPSGAVDVTELGDVLRW